MKQKIRSNNHIANKKFKIKKKLLKILLSQKKEGESLFEKIESIGLTFSHSFFDDEALNTFMGTSELDELIPG